MSEAALSAHSRVADALGDAPPVSDRPALAKLSADQINVFSALLDGFDDRCAILTWMQAVSIQTLGQLDDDWFPRLACDADVVSALLGAPWGPIKVVSPGRIREIRLGIAAKDLLPATQAANREFRWTASDYHTDEQGEAPDPTKQRHPGMRPGMSLLDDAGAWTLSRLLDGFDKPEAFLIWGQYAVSATYSELESSTIEDAYFDLEVRARLTDKTSARARFFRESWAAEYLLPGFNKAAARLAARTTEVPETHATKPTTPRG
ncbi:hypothetical protein [Haladaptatus sp. CMSO5]|uniref:hypothetical protein n=1 Tax=Haladaptatus sp. CMSO5 TaxID=3120514 RepID=UPI002FCE4980